MSQKTSTRSVTLLHFNDVYQIQGFPGKPQGGAPRFVSKVKEFQGNDPIILFSGDAYSPSLLSIQLLGAQMVQILNKIGVHVACLGNHDLDFGLPQFKNLVAQQNFPWIVSNLVDKRTGHPLGDLSEYQMIEKNGLKIGVMGIMEQEWLATLSEVDPKDLQYTDFVQKASEMCRTLKQQGADLVVALTHMRVENDQILAQEVQDLDLILGGHDHTVFIGNCNEELYHETPNENGTNLQNGNVRKKQKVRKCGPLIVKSGTDFKNLSSIDLQVFEDQAHANEAYQTCVEQTKQTSQKVIYKKDNMVFKVEGHVIDNSVQQDQETQEIVEYYMKDFEKKLDMVIGYTIVDIEGRFDKIRSQETNLGSFICDLLMEYTNSDVALLNSGTFRSDMIHKEGQFQLKDLVSILPMNEDLVVIEITGNQLLGAMENSVSQYPKFEGRFPQVAGLSFTFDPLRTPGNRIIEIYQQRGEEKRMIEMEQRYKLATKEYLYHGKDGFDALKEGKVVMESEFIPILSQMLKQHFMKLDVLTKLHGITLTKQLSQNKEKASIAMAKKFIDKLKKSQDNLSKENSNVRQFMDEYRKSNVQKIENKQNLCSINQHNLYAINPHVYGRINII